MAVMRAPHNTRLVERAERRAFGKYEVKPGSFAKAVSGSYRIAGSKALKEKVQTEMNHKYRRAIRSARVVDVQPDPATVVATTVFDAPEDFFSDIEQYLASKR